MIIIIVIIIIITPVSYKIIQMNKLHNFCSINFDDNFMDAKLDVAMRLGQSRTHQCSTFSIFSRYHHKIFTSIIIMLN